jgi:phage gp46-like protein
MADYALAWSNAAGGMALAVDEPDIDRDDGLLPGVLVSLFCDAPAREGDEIPDGTPNRRGWWGDEHGEVPGDRIGSRLWLLARALKVAHTLKRAEDYAREALAWVLEDRVTERVDVSASFLDSAIHEAGYVLTVTLRRPARPPEGWRFSANWDAELLKVEAL